MKTESQKRPMTRFQKTDGSDSNQSERGLQSAAMPEINWSPHLSQVLAKFGAGCGLKSALRASGYAFLLMLGFSSSAQTIFLSNAIIHTVSGDIISPGQLLIQDGKIAAVGLTVATPNAPTLDLQGQHLYPGLIALNTALGLTEISAVRSTQDTTEVGDYTPDVESWIAVNPDSELLPVARGNGIAYFQPTPEGGIVGGQSGLVAMDGWTSE